MDRSRVELADLRTMGDEIRRRSFAFNRRPGARNNRGRIPEPSGGSVVNRAAPALFVGGQSNSGNVDTVPGTVDPRVTFTWYGGPGPSFTGPGAMALQNSAGNNGHSYEWQCAADMAANYNSSILVGKTWSDGSTCDAFCRRVGAIAWPSLCKMIANFAGQCVAAGISQVAFIWDQGSSEALLVNAALTPQLTANTQSAFASIRALFKAWGIGRVRFYVMQQNSNFTGLSGIDTAQLNSVRAQEAAIVSADGDAVLINCDDITMASGYHYASGQTNTIGARFAALIAADFTSIQPSFVTPPTVASIFGATLVHNLNSREGIAVATGQPIPLWTDKSGNNRNGVQASTPAQPLYLANAQGSNPGVQFDGSTDVMPIVNMTLPVPSVTPTWTWEIVRPDGYSLGGRVWGGAAGTPALLFWSVSPNMQFYNGSFTPASCQINEFNRIESYASNSNAAYTETGSTFTSGDYIKVQETRSSGTNVGNTALGDIQLGQGGTVYAAFTMLERIVANALPTKPMLDDLCGYYVHEYGTAPGVT